MPPALDHVEHAVVDHRRRDEGQVLLETPERRVWIDLAAETRRLERGDAVLADAHGPGVVVFHGVDHPAAVGVDPAEVLAHALLGRPLRSRQLTVLVGVEGLQRGRERFHPRFVAGERGYDHRVVVCDGRADSALRRQRHPPQRLAARERIAIEARRAEHHELRLGAATGREHHRRGPRHRRPGPRAAPAFAAGLAIERDHERPAHLIADEDHRVAGDDRRAGHAVEVLERAERRVHSCLAVRRIGGEPEVGEEGHDALPVGGRRRRGADRWPCRRSACVAG